MSLPVQYFLASRTLPKSAIMISVLPSGLSLRTRFCFLTQLKTTLLLQVQIMNQLILNIFEKF